MRSEFSINHLDNNDMKPYPYMSENWNNIEETLFREFYIRSSNDFDILKRLVSDNMSDKGNEGETKCRLIHLLQSEADRALYILHQKRKYKYTWFFRWQIRLARHWYFRRFKTKTFKQQLFLCQIANDILKEERI